VRALAAALMLLQGGFLMAGPPLDGALEASSARTTSHVEGVNGSKCPRVHCLADCAICRTLTDRGAPAAPAGAIAAGAESLARGSDASLGAAAARPWRSDQSRAPPAAGRRARIA
jgi:hypothetical protein